MKRIPAGEKAVELLRSRDHQVGGGSLCLPSLGYEPWAGRVSERI
jgi:hypothetical protein